MSTERNVENMWHWNALFIDRMFFRMSPQGIEVQRTCRDRSIVSSGAHDIFLYLVPSSGKKFQTTGIMFMGEGVEKAQFICEMYKNEAEAKHKLIRD
jgi:hypothetical protein